MIQNTISRIYTFYRGLECKCLSDAQEMGRTNVIHNKTQIDATKKLFGKTVE